MWSGRLKVSEISTFIQSFQFKKEALRTQFITLMLPSTATAITNKQKEKKNGMLTVFKTNNQSQLRNSCCLQQIFLQELEVLQPVSHNEGVLQDQHNQIWQLGCIRRK